MNDRDNDGVFETVCAGYASMFNVLCSKYNIPCINIEGFYNENHEWNAVQMEDGVWYAVDVTWDDGDPYNYEYLLVGNNTYVLECQNIFSNSHLAGQCDISERTMKENFRFLEISDEKYISEDESPITIDNTDKIIYLNGNNIRIYAGSEGKTKIQFESNGSYGVADLDPDTIGIQQEANLSEYTIYGGMSTSDVDSVNIIMDGGTVKNIYGTGSVYKAINGVSIIIEDGTVLNEIAAGNSNGTNECFSVTGNTITSGFNNCFAIENGEYIVKGNAIIPSDSTVTVPSGKTLLVDIGNDLDVRGHLYISEGATFIYDKTPGCVYPATITIDGNLHYVFDGTARITSKHNIDDLNYDDGNDIYPIYYTDHPITEENGDIRILYPIKTTRFTNSNGDKLNATAYLDGFTKSYENNNTYWTTMKVVWTKGNIRYEVESYVDNAYYYGVSIIPYNGVYDGETHDVVSFKYSNGVHFGEMKQEFSVDGGETFTETMPTITDLGEVSVIVRLTLEGADSYTYGTVTAKVCENEIDSSKIIITPYTGAYDGNEHNAVTISGIDSKYTVEYMTTGEYTTTVPKIKEIGTLNVTIKISANGYCDYITSATATVLEDTRPEINPSTVTITPYVGEYDGLNHRAVYVSGISGTIYYRLSNSVPYTTSYPKIKNIGTYTIDIKIVKEGYKDFYTTTTAIINKASVSDPDAPSSVQKGTITVLDIPEQTYTGKAIKPEIKVYNGQEKLTLNKDYTVSYKNNVKAGTATVTVKGKGNLKDKKVITFDILPKQLNSSDITVFDLAVAYNKKMQKKIPTITYNGKNLRDKVDFTFERGSGNFTDTGSYSVTFTGTGNYTGTITGKLVIIEKTKMINLSKIKAIPVQTYSNEPIVPLLTVTLNKQTLVQDKDYTVEYLNNINPGKATVIVTGCGEYAGVKKATFTIKRPKTTLTSDMVSLVSDMTYLKSGCKPLPTVICDNEKLVLNKDYTVSYTNNKKAGIATVIIRGKGYYKGTIKKTFTIHQEDITETVMRAPDVIYKGKKGQYVSKPVLIDCYGNILSLNKDYYKTVYTIDGQVLDKKANPQDGAVITVTVTGKGNYCGTLSTTYTLKSATAFSKVAVKGYVKNKIQKAYTGNKVELTPDDIIVTYKKETLTYGTDYEIVPGTYRNNIKKGTATVVIKGLGAFAGEKTIKFTITAKSINN